MIGMIGGLEVYPIGRPLTCCFNLAHWHRETASGLGELQIWNSPEAVKPDAGAPVADRNPAHAEVPSPGKDETTSAADISDTVENACTIGPSRREMAVTARVKRKTYSPASSEDSWVQQQLESLWDAMKWVEDRVEVADAQRREELQKASRTAAQNTARVRCATLRCVGGSLFRTSSCIISRLYQAAMSHRLNLSLSK